MPCCGGGGKRRAAQVLVQRAAVATEKMRMAEEKAEELREALLQAEGEGYAPDVADFAKASMKKAIEGCLNQAPPAPPRQLLAHRREGACAPAPARSSSWTIRTCGCGSRIR
jgi:hypothetical protein